MFTWFGPTSALAKLNQSAQIQQIQAQLNLERFSFYVLLMADRVEETWSAHWAEDLRRLAFSEKELQSFTAAQLQDPAKYDRALYDWLRARHGDFKISYQEFQWSWNFLKNALQESFLIKPVSRAPDAAASDIRPLPIMQLAIEPARDMEDHTLNVHKYISERHSLALLQWAVRNGLDLYVGTHRDFLREIERQGSEILGEIQPRGRDYNKTYLIRTVEGNYRAAVTEIGGMSRLRHFQNVIAWILAKEGLWQTADVRLYGDVEEFVERQTKQLTEQLETLPEADLILIGQKSFWERGLRAWAQLSALKKWGEQSPHDYNKKLTVEERSRLAKLYAAVEGGRIFQVIESASFLRELTERFQTVFERLGLSYQDVLRDVQIQNPAFDYADYLVPTAAGLKRWRIFSNVWGDEVRIITNALGRVKFRAPVVYIGTAGALDGSNIKVGNGVVPSRVRARGGQVFSLEQPLVVPEGFLSGVTVGTVDTPLEETADWLQKHRSLIDLVEVESEHLADTGSRYGLNLTLLLVASDVVGTQSTLDSANSKHRRRSLIAAANAIGHAFHLNFFEPPKAELTATGKLESYLSAELEKREEVSRFQLQQIVREKNPRTLAQLQNLIRYQKSFSDSYMEKSLVRIENLLAQLRVQLDEAGLRPRVYVKRSFFEGQFNPKVEKFAVRLRPAALKIESEAKNAVTAFLESQPESRKILDIQLDRGPPGEEWVLVDLDRLSYRGDLIRLFQEIARTRGGLLAVESKSSELRFVRARVPCSDDKSCQLSFFKPDAETEELIKRIGKGKDLKEELNSVLEYINKHWGESSNFEIDLRVVKSLPGGDWAVIEPDLSDDQVPVIALKMTSEALNSPVAVLEEIIHIFQITNLEHSYNDTTKMYIFTHPYQWMEIHENARLGSPFAQLKLARAELEAIQASEHWLLQAKQLFSENTSDELIRAYFDRRRAHAEENYAAAMRAYKSWRKKALAAFEKQKQKWPKHEEKTRKLDDLVATNDRKGAAALIRDYLPWPLMEPLESRAWQKWLHAMEFPDWKNAQVLFRGLQGDTIGNANKDNKFLMSTVLMRNQGSYTRRLRSLYTMRERLGQTQFHKKELNPTPYRLNGPAPSTLGIMMVNHNLEPIGSPFISASDLEVAFTFGSYQLAALRIDKARRLMNALAVIHGENEHLIPLIVFPDEIIALHDYKKDPRGTGSLQDGARKADFQKMVEKTLGRKLTSHEQHAKYLKNRDFLKHAYKEWRDLLFKSFKGDAKSSKSSDDCVTKLKKKK